MENICDFALHTGLRAAYWLTHPPQSINLDKFSGCLARDKSQITAAWFVK